MHIQSFKRFIRIGCRLCPTFVEQHIRNATRRSKINIILICFLISAHYKIDVIRRSVMPPLPNNLSRTNPRGIFHCSLCCQTTSKRIFHQITIFTSHYNVTPRERAFGLSFGNIICLSNHVDTAITDRFCFQRITGEQSRNAFAFVRF